ncbi:MAG: hypothetical protein ACYC6K_12020 [Bellilinea sp.]
MIIDSATQQMILFFVQIASLIFLIIYVIKTWEMASATRKAAEATEKSVLEMREQRDTEIAPYIVAYLDGQGTINGKLYLVIKNTGKSVAKNVKVIFDPPLQTKFSDTLNRVLPPNGIPSIPPGYEIKTIIDYFITYKEYGPMAFDVSVIYSGGISDKLREDKYHLDLEIFRGIVYSVENKPPSETVKAINELNSSIESVVEELRKIDVVISEGSKGIKNIKRHSSTKKTHNI